MSLSHAHLRRLYLQYNRRWFQGALPEDMDVFYAPDDEAHGLAVQDRAGEKYIKIDTAIAGTRFARLTLLHECCHHLTGDFTHGKKFQAAMQGLAAIGAFKNIW